MIRDDAPLFMVRHSVREQLLSAAQILLDDRLSDVDALAQVANSMAAVLIIVENLERLQTAVTD
ncbi:MAG: hypothetical protein AB7R89_23255 [Dehalococcoidia bacterium]